MKKIAVLGRRASGRTTHAQKILQDAKTVVSVLVISDLGSDLVLDEWKNWKVTTCDAQNISKIENGLAAFDAVVMDLVDHSESRLQGLKQFIQKCTKMLLCIDTIESIDSKVSFSSRKKDLFLCDPHFWSLFDCIDITWCIEDDFVLFCKTVGLSLPWEKVLQMPFRYQKNINA